MATVYGEPFEAEVAMSSPDGSIRVVGSAGPGGAGAFDLNLETITFASTITPNAATSNKKVIVQTANMTFAAPTNPANGRILLFRLHMGGAGSYSRTWNAIYRFSGDLILANCVPSTSVGAVDRIGFEYNSIDSVWDAVSYLRGQ